MYLIYKLSTGLVIGSTLNGLPSEDEGIVEIPSDFVYKLPVYTADGVLVSGTYLTPDLIYEIEEQVIDTASRFQTIKDYLSTLVGKNFADCTELERWRLVAIVMFFHGMLDANGVIKPLDKWRPL